VTTQNGFTATPGHGAKAATATPRVLYVTPHAFNKVTGGGITFTNLFTRWPQECIATVHNDPEPTTNEVCDRYYVLGPEELDYAPPFGLLRRRFGNRGGTGVPSANPRRRGRMPGAAKSALLGALGNSLPESARLTPALERWIAEFDPQLLYTILGSNGMMGLIEEIRARFNLPVAVHIMDDWPAALHRRGLLAPGLRREMERLLRHFFDVAVLRLGISPAMCTAYEARYGHPFAPFQNTIDTARWAPLAKKDLTASTPADILYVGSIFPGAQLESLAACCRAVAQLNAEGLAARLTISSPSNHGERYRGRLQTDPAIQIVDTIGDDESFFRRIAAADVLLLPVNFSEESVRFIRYSMPTKVPAYLTVGTPILVYGPRETAQVAYAGAAGWGHVVGEPDMAALTEGLRRVIGDVELRRRLSQTAREVAAENHDAATVRARFQHALRQAAATKAADAATETRAKP
jgi:glycosyltransferase involved in cell wall biosynthesis